MKFDCEYDKMQVRRWLPDQSNKFLEDKQEKERTDKWNKDFSKH